MGKILTAEDIIGVMDLEPTKIEVPEWGGSIHIRKMSGTDRGKFSAWSADHKDDINSYTYALHMVLAMTICDEAGALLFSENKIDELGKKNSDVLDRLWNISAELNGLTEKSVEDAEKN